MWRKRLENKSTVATKTSASERKLRLVTEEEQWVGGVCGGVAYWLGAPVWLVRLLWASSIIFFGFGVGLYILLWIFMPNWDKMPEDYKKITGD
ncbi:MAG: PspC domain-containing protein [Parcubacteria group bacterium]|nr:PspC domain-containing protein [Parcubacteria group bacterium]